MAAENQYALRFLCFGVGAIGTYIGGSLALRGQKVVFLERPEVALEVRGKGLHLQKEGQEYHIPNPDVVGSINEALTRGPYDVSILAVKGYDTQSLLESIAPYTVALPPILCLQNGVDNEAALATVMGSERVIRGTVTTAVGRRAAGDIIVERLRGLGIASEHLLTANLAAAMNDAGLHARLYPHGLGMKWSKMVTNLIANASSAILGMTPAEIFAHPGLYRMEIAQLREALRVMHAQDIPVVDLPGTPVRLLTFAVKYLPPILSQPLLQRSVGKGRGDKMPSFYLDLQSGRGKSEVDYLNGAVVRAGTKLGIPTPVNRVLNTTLMAMTNGELPKEEFFHQPDKLLKLVKMY